MSYRELDYWVRRGVVVPERGARGSGTQRLFAPQDVQAVALVASLRSAGVPLERCGRAVAAARMADTDDRWLVLEDRAVSTVAAGELEQALSDADGVVVVDLRAVNNLVLGQALAVPA